MFHIASFCKLPGRPVDHSVDQSSAVDEPPVRDVYREVMELVALDCPELARVLRSA